jgi:hypothetical protein
VSLNLTVGRNHGVNGLEIGYIGNWNLGDVEGVQIAGGLNLVEGNLNALQVSSFANRVNGDARGFQGAGLINSVGGRLDGAQWSSALNVVSGSGRGIQAASLVNLTGGRFEGIQVAGLVNAAQCATGLQAAGLWNLAHQPGQSCQLGGVGNMASDLEGAQLGGVFNYSAGMQGLQLSGVTNLARGHVEGAQVCGVANAAESVHGLQLAVINVARTAQGTQIGVVNVGGSVTGAQIGVVNVAGQVSGAPVGVISLVQHGQQNVTAWTSDTGAAMLGVKLGNDRVYSILCGGTEEVGGDRHYAGFGLGVNLPLRQSVFGTLELLSQYIYEDKDPDLDVPNEDLHLLNQARVGLGWQIARRLALIGGPTVNVFTSGRNDGASLAGGHTWYAEQSGDTWVRVWPGFFFGIQI